MNNVLTVMHCTSQPATPLSKFDGAGSLPLWQDSEGSLRTQGVQTWTSVRSAHEHRSFEPGTFGFCLSHRENGATQRESAITRLQRVSHWFVVQPGCTTSLLPSEPTGASSCSRGKATLVMPTRAVVCTRVHKHEPQFPVAVRDQGRRSPA